MTKVWFDCSEGGFTMRALTEGEAVSRNVGGDVALVEDRVFEAYQRHADQTKREIDRLNHELARSQRLAKCFEDGWWRASGRSDLRKQLIVPDADILVGVPCYKDGLMVDRCLRTLQEPGVQLLIIDNGSEPDVKQAITDKGILIENVVNRYVNPAWNQMMRFFLDWPGKYGFLVLANSDLVLDAGWSVKLRVHREAHEGIIFGMDAPRNRSSMGSFFAMTPRAVAASYPIPDDLLIMGGDDFIFHVSRGVGCAEMIDPAITMTHVERGTYDKSPEIWDVARRDTDRWNEYVFRDLVPQRIREFLSREARSART